jgi:cytochrome c5
MRSLSSWSAVQVVVASAIVVAAVAAGCQTPAAAVGGVSRGERFFQTKCNACHPNGGQGAGPPIDLAVAPDFLERGKSSGRHGVPEADWAPLMAHLQERLGGGAPAAVDAAAGAAAAPAAGVAAPVVAAAPAGDAVAGAAYYQAKCAKCHPGGNKIPGKPVPGVLVSGGSGKHGVPAEHFDNVVAHLLTLGAVRAGGAVAAPVAAVPPPVAAPVVVAAAPAGDPAVGGAYFQTKCAKCHPGGNKITGRSIPGVLQSGGSGKHGVPADQFEPLLAYLTTIGAVRAGSAPVAAAPTGVPTTTTSPPPPPPPAGTIPMNAGMVNCSCACQCPANTPPEALPAACLCQCSCPR